MEPNVQGTWKLESFQLEGLDGERRDWGSNTQGILVYANTGHMNVAIYKDVENDPEQSAELNHFDSVLCYSGTYRVEGNVIKHLVTEATNPDRIGKEMIRYAEFSGDTVTLTTPKESFGRAILVWKKV